VQGDGSSDKVRGLPVLEVVDGGTREKNALRTGKYLVV